VLDCWLVEGIELQATGCAGSGSQRGRDSYCQPVHHCRGGAM